jgi:prepilin-type N-terminal cleavage/methylation domain-containing protein
MKQLDKGFTLVELLVVIALIGMLVVLLMPALASAKNRDAKITCISNLKQVGLAFRLWEGEHNDRYPMAISSYGTGGTSEFLAHSSGSATPTAPGRGYGPGMSYLVMSNELSTPKTLFCPADNIHAQAATNFSYSSLLGLTSVPGSYGSVTQTGENGTAFSRVSYFVNADATEANPQDIISGDDNIGNQTSSLTGAASYRFGASANSPLVSGASAATCGGITTTAYSAASHNWAWTANDFHRNFGNLGFTDGSCQSASIASFHYFLSNSTNSTPTETFNFMP